MNTTAIALSWDAYKSAATYDVTLDGTSLRQQVRRYIETLGAGIFDFQIPNFIFLNLPDVMISLIRTPNIMKVEGNT